MKLISTIHKVYHKGDTKVWAFEYHGKPHGITKFSGVTYAIV